MKGKKTGGRKKGSKNKRTRLLDAQAAKKGFQSETCFRTEG